MATTIKTAVTAAGLVALLALVACGGDDGTTTATATRTAAGAAVSSGIEGVPIPESAEPHPSLDPTTIYGGPTHDAFPAVTRDGDGDLVVAFRIGADHYSDGRIAIARKTARRWRTRTVYDSPGDDRVSVGLTRYRGSLLLPVVRDWHASLLRFGSGKRWEADRIAANTTPYGRIVRVRSTLLMPAYRPDGAVVLRSADGGKSWGGTSLIGRGLNETSLIRLGDDELLAIARSETRGFEGPSGAVAPEARAEGLYAIRSRDGGRSWGRAHRIFPGVLVSPDLIRVPGGGLLLCYADRGPQTAILCRTSSEGRRWSAPEAIYDAPTEDDWDFGYPASLVLGSGKVFSAFYDANFDIQAVTHRP